ncbi:MAG: hypothetical protein E7Z76_00920 [Methanobrevibacter sp.]|nr:hypothetical protein [Methanobrevibacter sp.]
MEELKIFIENLDFDGRFITHHTISMNLNNVNFRQNKEKILQNLQKGIENLDMDKLTQIRNNKRDYNGYCSINGFSKKTFKY